MVSYDFYSLVFWIKFNNSGMRKFLFSLVLICYMNSLVAGQGEDFLAIREAFRTGDAVRVAFYARNLQNYVLAPYVEYYQLRLYLGTADINTIRAFLLVTKIALLQIDCVETG